MSKKRALILVTALLPLGVGGAVVVSLKGGSRAVEPIPVASEAALLDASLDDADGSAPLLVDLEVESLPAFIESGAAPSSIGEPLAQPSHDEAQTLAASDAPPSESMPAGDGPVASDTQLAALVDDGWQLYRRSSASLGSMNIGLAGRARGGGGGSGGGSAGGESSSGADSGGGDTAPSGQDGNTHPIREPSNGSNGSDGSTGTGGSSGEGGSNGGSDGSPADVDPNEPPQDQPPTKHEGTKPPVEDVGGSDPIDGGGDGPIYIPPHDVNPPVVQVPEPATLGLLGLGLLGCAVARRRKAR